MAVQAQVYSDHNQSNNNGNNMGFYNFNQNGVLMPGSSVFEFGDEHKSMVSSNQQDQGFVGFGSDNRNLVSTSNSITNGMMGFQNLSSELERQRLEMHSFLHFQNVRLKDILNEETRKREAILIQHYESKMKAVIDERDEAFNTARIRSTKLQYYLTLVAKEIHNWERKVMESEAMITELNKKLKEAKESTHEDAESVCDVDDYEKERRQKMVCKVCHVRSTCVLLLPCRHLCCCSYCEGLVVFCPVCGIGKNTSLEIYLV